ncbi:hypothetical protein ES703_34102 [subsurface metagenome]
MVAKVSQVFRVICCYFLADNFNTVHLTSSSDYIPGLFRCQSGLEGFYLALFLFLDVHEMLDPCNKLIRGGFEEARYCLKIVYLLLYFPNSSLSGETFNSPDAGCNCPFTHQKEDTYLSC